MPILAQLAFGRQIVDAGRPGLPKARGKQGQDAAPPADIMALLRLAAFCSTFVHAR